MLCRKCKKEIPANSKFCNHCGAAQEQKRSVKKRGNGQGSVYKVGKTWTAAKIFGYQTDESGKLRPFKVTRGGFKTKSEALEHLPKMRPSDKKRTTSNNPITLHTTVKQMYDLWYPTHEARGKSKSTMGNYSAAILHFSDVWDIPFSEMSIEDWQECIDECVRGRRTKENMKALVGLLYKHAIPRGGSSNNLNLSEYLFVTGEKGRRPPFTQEELEIIRKNIGIVDYAEHIYCNCYLGYRPAEFISRTIDEHFNKEEKCIYGGIKTKAGQLRTVTISPKIESYITKIIGNRETGCIFCRIDGNPFTTSKYREVFAEALKQMGIESTPDRKLTPYSCRHTFASMTDKIIGNDNAKLELMGHTEIDTLRHYQHADLEALRQITDNI